MASESQTAAAPTAAKVLAPEDVAPGDYVAVLDEEIEYPAIAWYCDRPLSGEDEVVRVRLRPRDTGAPLLVTDVCTPFVFTESADGKCGAVDLRATRLARIDSDTARRVRKAMGSKRKPRHKRGKKQQRNS